MVQTKQLGSVVGPALDKRADAVVVLLYTPGCVASDGLAFDAPNQTST